MNFLVKRLILTSRKLTIVHMARSFTLIFYLPPPMNIHRLLRAVPRISKYTVIGENDIFPKTRYLRDARRFRFVNVFEY